MRLRLLRTRTDRGFDRSRSQPSPVCLCCCVCFVYVRACAGRTTGQPSTSSLSQLLQLHAPASCGLPYVVMARGPICRGGGNGKPCGRGSGLPIRYPKNTELPPCNCSALPACYTPTESREQATRSTAVKPNPEPRRMHQKKWTRGTRHMSRVCYRSA